MKVHIIGKIYTTYNRCDPKRWWVLHRVNPLKTRVLFIRLQWSEDLIKERGCMRKTEETGWAIIKPFCYVMSKFGIMEEYEDPITILATPAKAGNTEGE